VGTLFCLWERFYSRREHLLSVGMLFCPWECLVRLWECFVVYGNAFLWKHFLSMGTCGNAFLSLGTPYPLCDNAFTVFRNTFCLWKCFFICGSALLSVGMVVVVILLLSSGTLFVCVNTFCLWKCFFYRWECFCCVWG